MSSASSASPLKNALSGAALLGLGVWIWFYAGTFPSLDDGHPGPALFPRLIAGGLVLAGAGLLAGGLRRGLQPRAAWGRLPWDAGGWGRLGAAVVLAALVPVTYPWIGFVPGVSALSVAVALLLGARIWTAAAVGIGGTLLIYGLFTQLLGVPL